MQRIVLLLAAVQFINILDFMMVMPLGPDFATALGIPTALLGWIVGSYTLAACIAGAWGSVHLDRFDRKRAFVCSVAGLAVATALGGCSQGFVSLLVARLLAGAFGGPASALALSIIADAVPLEKRGKAMGTLMGSFSLAAVLGVPAGLELARLGSWRTPFWAIGGLALVGAFAAHRVLPPLRAHLEPKEVIRFTIRDLLVPKYFISLATISLAILSVFVLVPNISTYVQYNLQWPREHLGSLYAIGGVFSLIAMQIGGRWVDRAGALQVFIVATVIVGIALFTGFIHYLPGMPVWMIFVLFMTGTSLRNVTMQTLISRVPTSAVRARYMSVQSALLHACTAAASFFSAAILRNDATGRLYGIPFLAMISLAFAALLPFLVAKLERLLEA